MQHPSLTLALSRHEHRALGRLWLLFCLFYVYELANFNVTIDDEILVQSGICHFADIGRWVHPLLRATLWPQVVVPSGPLLLFGLALTVSFLYVARMFGVARLGVFHYTVFAAFALFPTWMAQLEFAANVLPDALGVLATSSAALLTLGLARARPRGGTAWWRWALAIVACTVAFGAYQSLGLMYLALVVGAGLSDFVVHRSDPAWADFARTLGRALVVLVLGLALSLVLARLMMLACDVQPSGYGRDALNFKLALSQPLNALGIAVNETLRLYFSFWRPFGAAGLTYLVTVAACCGAIVWLSAPGTRWRVGGVLAMLLLIPAGLSLVGVTTMAVRTYFAGACVLLVLLLLAHALCRSAMQRRAVLTLALLCAMQGLYVYSVQQARGWVSARHDTLLAGAIQMEIMRLRGPDDGRPVHVNVRGSRRIVSVYPGVDTTTTGASFFEWDGGNPWRVAAYMRLLGFADVRPYDEGASGRFDADYAQMPVWPAPGSVRRIDDVYLVKLSETTSSTAAASTAR